MKKYKNIIISIFKIITFIAFYKLIDSYENPLMGILIITFWLLVLIYNIYYKIEYRRKKYNNEIRFPTYNDNFYKTTSITLGCFIFIGSLIWIVLMKDFKLIQLGGILMGGIVFTNGIIDLPKGHLKVLNSKIKLNGVKNSININEIKSINIKNDQITINSRLDKKVKIKNLLLDEKWILKISDFIKNRLDTTKIEITCGSHSEL